LAFHPKIGSSTGLSSYLLDESMAGHRGCIREAPIHASASANTSAMCRARTDARCSI